MRLPAAAGLTMLVLSCPVWAQVEALPGPPETAVHDVESGAAEAAHTAAPRQGAATAAQSTSPSNASGEDFAVADAVIDLGPAFSGSRVTDPAVRGDTWFTVNVANRGQMLAARLLVVADAPTAGLAVEPLGVRPTLVEAAASDPEILIEQAAAFGPNVFRVILAPGQSTALALHFVGASDPPSVLAWTQPALIAHNRQVAVLAGAVGALFAAALAFAAAAAGMNRRPFAIWAALFLASLMLANLAAARVLDETLLTALGGPYGLFALALALAVASGLRLVDHVASYEAFRPWAGLTADSAAIAVLALGTAAFLGLPGAGLAIRIFAVAAAAAAAGYLTHCGRLGVAGARRLAPAATIFALVCAAAAFRASGVFGTSVVAPAAISGFAAVGGMLVALTAGVAADEPTVSRLRAMRRAHRDDDLQATATDEAIAEGREHEALAASRQGVFDLDLESGLLALSPEAKRILGLGKTGDEISHESWLARVNEADRPTYETAMEACRKQPGLAFRLEFRARGPDQREEWYELRATMTGAAKQAVRCLGLIANVSARKSLESAGAHSPDTDALTGLANRLSLLARLEAADTLAGLGLAVFDLDRFKSVDTSLGPEKADALLRTVAERLAEGLGKDDELFRVGGDTFAILTPRPGNPESFGRSIIARMAAPFDVAGRNIFLPLSAGIALGEKDGDDAQNFLARAELAMVHAKHEGGGRVVVYSDDLDDPRLRRAVSDPVELDSSLRHALESGEIEVHYQPIMRVADGSVAGFEALLRWHHPEYGIIEPGEFIPYAERTGLILPLGRLALTRAAEDLARWQQFFPLDPPLFASVNVSWRQIASQDFAKDLRTLLKEANVAPHSLRLEVTESEVMAGAKKAETELKRLRALGAGLAIDDFGTGHSSLSHLRRFPFDAVKIDKSFLAAGEKEKTILNSMVQLAHQLGLQVVAEGVESEEDARRLKRLRCEYAQGYFFGAPLPAPEVPNFIAMTYAR